MVKYEYNSNNNVYTKCLDCYHIYKSSLVTGLRSLIG